MAFSNPSVADFQAYFNRDFPYGTDPTIAVLDSDITKTFLQTNVLINSGLFGDQSSYTLGYLLLSAHFLVLDMRASSQGLNGQFAFLQQSKGVGSVNVGFAIPPRILENPFWSMLSKTNYGAQFLQLVLPQLSGQIFVAVGTTLP